MLSGDARLSRELLQRGRAEALSQGDWHETCLTHRRQAHRYFTELSTTTTMISLASFLLALVTAPSTTHALAPPDTTPLSARPLTANAAATDSTALDSIVSPPIAPTSVMLAPSLLAERRAKTRWCTSGGVRS